MLPGFRFLFAAVVLSLSLVVFGLGAVSLLRSAREEVASLPIGRAPPETIFNQGYDNQPRLAMLRVETPVRQDTPAAASKEPVSTDLTSSDLTSVDPLPQPDANAAASTAVATDAPVNTAAASQADPSKPSAEPEKLAALTPAPTQNDTALPTAPQSTLPQAVEATPTTPVDAAAPAESTPTSETATADKPVAAPPASMVTASLAPDQAPAAASNAAPATSEAAPAAAPTSEPATSSASASNTTQLAALTDPTTSTEELTPSEPIPAGMVPMPRLRPSLITTKKIAQKHKKISKPRRVAIRIQQPAPAAPAAQFGSPFN